MSSRRRGFFFALGLVVCAASSLPAAGQGRIVGRLIDGTHGGPGTAERVNLLQLAGGMSQIASRDQVTGSFEFELPGPGPYLVQAERQGVIYTERVMPSGPAALTVELTTFEATTETGDLQITIPHMIAIVDGSTLHVTHVYELHNTTQPPRSIVGEPGAFRFDVPPSAKVISASITSSAIPLRQEPTDPRDDRGMTIAQAIKPGVTRYELVYELPYSGAAEIVENLYHGVTAIHVITLPAEVEVEAEGLASQGVSERQGVSFRSFSGRDLPPGHVLRLRITGAGVAPRPPGGVEAQAQPEGAIEEVDSWVARGWRKAGILAAALALLGAAVMAGLAQPRAATPATTQPTVSASARELVAQLAALDRDRSTGAIDAVEHGERRAALKRELVEELRAARRSKKTA